MSTDITNKPREKGVFDNFTNLYEFSKTLTFGLIPLKWDDNKKMIVEDEDFSVLRKYGVIEEDKRIAESIKIAKFYLNILHRELIGKVLGSLKFEKKNLENYDRLLGEIEKNNKNENISEDKKKEIRKNFKKELSIAQDILLKKVGEVFESNGSGILSSKNCLDELTKRFTRQEVDKLRRENKDIGVEYPDVAYREKDGKEETKSFFAMDVGYLDDFHKNRKQLYSVKGKKNSLGRRILDNFEIFCKNKKLYEKYKNLDIDFSEIERNFNLTLEKVFDFDNYNERLTQEGLDEYAKILGGESNKQERTANIHGLNQIINLYIQKKQSEQKAEQKETGKKKIKFNKKDYPTFTCLQKQILSQVFRKEIIIESDRDLIRELKFFVEESKEKVDKARGIIEFLLNHEENDIDLAMVYLPKSKINSFVYKVFKEPQDFLSVFQDGASNLDFVSFDKIKTHLENNKLTYKIFFKTLIKENHDFESFLILLQQEIDLLIDGGETVTLGGKKESITSLDEKKNRLKEKLGWFEGKVRENEKMKDEEEGEFCSTVLAYSQAVLNITKRAEIFWLNEKQDAKVGEDNKDMIFYKKFDEFADDGFAPFFYFDKFGNYLKRRSRNTTKEIKLHFGNDDLLEGWDMNKEPEYWSFILRDRNQYYLGIGKKDGEIFHKKLGNSVEAVKEAYELENEADFYEKIDYKQLNIDRFEGIAFPKKTKTEEAFRQVCKKRADEFLGGDTYEFKILLAIKKEYDDFKARRQKEKDWDSKFSKEKMSKLIEYYITCLGKRDDWKRFNLNFRQPKEYEDRSDFVRHIQRQAYWIDPRKVSKDYVDKKVAEGEMFLFKVHNKDFYDFERKSEDKKNHTANLFTQYLLELFSCENIKNIKSKDLIESIFELDGKAEIRFRPKTDDVKLKIYQKKGKDVTYADKRDGNKEKEVIQHRRFAKDALTLHLKIRLNFGKHVNLFDFNKLVNTELFAKVPVKILGMDRGENNLIYYCFLDEHGEIENGKCGSLNRVGEQIITLEDDKKVKEPVDYFQLLVDREGQRDWEQKNWQKMTRIKDLKKAYLGNVVSWISKEMLSGIKEGVVTIGVLEDLNSNFKRTRFFRERQVYQGFEKALVNKLGYLVDKKYDNYRNVYQFAPIVDSVEEMEKNKQIGTLVYVPASYTSKICPHPKCGWRERLYMKNSASKEKIVGLLKSDGIKISYDQKNDRFYFEYQWEQEHKSDGKKKKYSGVDKVFSNVSRMRWDVEQKKSIDFVDGTDGSITNKLKSLLKGKGIELDNINQQIVNQQKELGVEFFQSIIFYFNLIMQIRNYDKEKSGSEADYIQCPSCLFDSRKPEMNGKLSAITNGDANGAYNIARKGFMQLCRIRENPQEPMKLITNREWDEAVREWDIYSAAQKIPVLSEEN